MHTPTVIRQRTVAARTSPARVIAPVTVPTQYGPAAIAACYGTTPDQPCPRVSLTFPVWAPLLSDTEVQSCA